MSRDRAFGLVGLAGGSETRGFCPGQEAASGQERARNDGYEALSLSVDRDNQGAIALYGQFGFEQVQETPDSVTLRVALA